MPEELTSFQRKLRKLKKDPKAWLIDSKGARGLLLAWAKLGSFVLVIVASIVLVVYFGVLASDRYASQSQFMVKEAGGGTIQLSGFGGLASSVSVRDSLVLKSYIESREMAIALDGELQLKKHYQNTEWDWFSRLSSSASTEDYIQYYRKYLLVKHDEMSDILTVEIQTYNPDYSKVVLEAILALSEEFINGLGDKVVQAQIRYAENEVERAYEGLRKQQKAVLDFQGKTQIFNPDEQGNSLLAAIERLRGEIISQEAELKSLLAVMHDSAPEVKSKKVRIRALKQQLLEEESRLINDDGDSVNKLAADFQEIKLNAELASNLYTSALSGLESIRTDAYSKLKHLLVVEAPAAAEKSLYPKRLYNITSWFLLLLIMYAIGKLIFIIIREHKD